MKTLRRITLSLTLATLATITPAGANPATPAAVQNPTDLPSTVFIKNHDASFSTEYDYALKDGKLWTKPRGEIAGWTLFQGTGLPQGKEIKSFAPGERIQAFSTEGLMVAAVSDKGRVYLWDPTKKGEPDAWHEDLGTPFSDALTLPPNRDWSFSLSVTPAPYKRKTPMKDIDSYYLDGAGNRIEFGFTATVYALDPDGRTIRFWDTGLPPSFHKAIDTPEKGQFIADRMATSGSTIFVVDKSGKMYTRMHDYEMFGACPGLRFSFDKIKHPELRNDVVGERALYDPIRVIPPADWQEQAFDLPLTGLAERTTDISIQITGQGDGARELRVRGRDAAGTYGYYYRPIAGTEWKFKPTGERYDSKIVVDTAPGDRVVAPKLAQTFDGSLSQSGAPALKAELVDFHHFGTSATLRVTPPNGHPIDMTMHTFDSWGPTVEEKAHPDLVGSPFGEPKLLVGTLEIPKPLLDSTDPAIKPVIDTYFRRFNLEHAAFAISADDGHVDIQSRLVQRDSQGYMDYSLRKPLSMSFKRDALALSKPMPITGETLSSVDVALANDCAALTQIEEAKSESRLTHLKDGLVAGSAFALFEVVNAFNSVTNITGHSPLWRNLSLTGGGTFKDYAKMHFKEVFRSRKNDAKTAQLLKARIQSEVDLRNRLMTASSAVSDTPASTP